MVGYTESESVRVCVQKIQGYPGKRLLYFFFSLLFFFCTITSVCLLMKRSHSEKYCYFKRYVAIFTAGNEISDIETILQQCLLCFHWEVVQLGKETTSSSEDQ